MPDDDRTRRRMGDDTRGRIADLASGWSIPEGAGDTSAAPPAATPPAATPPLAASPAPPATPPLATSSSLPASSPPVVAPPEPARRKPKTVPPPAPGSLARREMEQAIIESAKDAAPLPAPPSPPPRPSGNELSPRAGTIGTTGPMVRTAAAPTAVAPSVITTSSLPVVTLPAARPTGSTAPPPTGSTAPPPVQPPRPTGSTAPPPVQPPRPKASTLPPGTPAIPPPPPRAKAVTAPPPIPPPPRAKAVTAPPPPPPRGDPTDEMTVPERDPDRALHPANLAVPVGEFDHAPATIDEGQLRAQLEQRTIKRDAASALLGLSEPQATVRAEVPIELLLQETAARVREDPTLRGDETAVDPPGENQTTPFERGDPTIENRGEHPGATAPAATAAPPTRAARPGRALGRSTGMRTVPSLPRRGGLAGDVRYVFTVLLGVSRSRRELAALELAQAERQRTRRRQLMALGRIAVATDGFVHPALARAREQLGVVEDQRSQHAGQVAAADSEADRIRRSRQARGQQHAADVAGIQATLAQVAATLEPLERQAQAVRRRTAELRASLAKLDDKIAATEASLVSVKGPKVERAEVQAEIATLRADREAVARDEPLIAAELDELSPRIAGAEASRADLQRRLAEATTAEDEDRRRADELLAAVGAKRKVVERAAADAEAARDKILVELGERLAVDRPRPLDAQVAALDEHDVEYATADRRVMELREILSSVNRWAVVRGALVMAAIAAAIAAAALWLTVLR